MATVLLTDLEVSAVEDLVYVYEDEELLRQVELAAASAVPYKRFLAARQLTLLISQPADIEMAAVSVDAMHFDSCTKAEYIVDHIRKREELKRLRDERIRAIRDMKIVIRHNASVDLCFVLDCTTSMKHYISTAKENIASFVSNIIALHPMLSLRLAFIGYRDHCDQDRLVVHRFSQDADEFQSVIAQQRASGGGADGPEDVFGALNVAAGLEWLSATRILYHIADYPCHGVEFHNEIHNGTGDSHPNGDPYGIQAVDFLKGLQGQQVRYYFGKITRYTDIMIRKFNEIADGDNYIKVTPMDDMDMIEVVTATVSDVVIESVSASGRTADGKHVAKREVRIVDSLPNWASIREEGAMVHKMQRPASLAELLNAVDDQCLEVMPEHRQYKVKMAPNAFGKGASKAAHYGQIAIKGSFSSPKDIIIKESLAAHPKYRSKIDYEKFLVCHRAASFLASIFSTIKDSDCPRIVFVGADLCQLIQRRTHDCSEYFYIIEQPVPGDFEKYNNNTGYCAPNPSTKGVDHAAVQCFSHWTHHISGGQLMVVDCQGSYCLHDNCFILTDPAVHCKDVIRFGGTNFGEVGMDHFFQSHRCNQFCRSMGLAVTAAVPLPDPLPAVPVATPVLAAFYPRPSLSPYSPMFDDRR